MKKIRAFAAECNCSPQNIYLHLKTYKEELDGHVFQAGRGKVLDDYACEFIRSIMNPKEVVADTELQQQLLKAQAVIMELTKERDDLLTNKALIESELRASEVQLLSSRRAEEQKNKDLQIEKEKNAALEIELEARDKALEEEKNRKLTIKERLTGKKNG